MAGKLAGRRAYVTGGSSGIGAAVVAALAAEGADVAIGASKRAGQAEATLEQHREIIRGLNSRDPAKAAAAMKAHLDAAYRSTVAVLDGPGLG